MDKKRHLIFHKIGLSGVAQDENPIAVKASAIFNIVIAVFILLIPIFWLIDQLPEYHVINNWLELTSWFIWCILVAEMSIMLMIVHRPWHYLKTNWLSIPIIILAFPLILSQIPYAILLRSIQFILFARYLTEILHALQRLFQVSQLGAIMLAFFIIVILSGIVIHSIDPSVKNVEEGIWWSLVTMATVGYGDVVPSSTEGRIFGAVVIVMGTVFFSLLTAQLAAYMIGEDEMKRDRDLLHTLKENQKMLLDIQKDDDERMEKILLELVARLDSIEAQMLDITQQSNIHKRNSPHESSE